MLNTCIASPNDTLDRHELGRARACRRRARAPRRRSRAATGSPPGLDHEHVAAGAEPGQQRLARERREHRGERRVDRVAALAQHVGAGLRAERMAGGDYAAAARPSRLAGRLVVSGGG